MNNDKLCESAYGVNQFVNAPVHSSNFCDAIQVDKWLNPNESLREIFVRRLKEEMTKGKISQNELAARCRLHGGSKTSQSNISRLLSRGQGLRIATLEVVSKALNKPYWYLLADLHQMEHLVISPPPTPPDKVKSIGYPYVPSVGKSVRKRTRRSKKRRR